MRAGVATAFGMLVLVASSAGACGIDAVGTMPDRSQTLPEGGGGPDGRAPDAAACKSITTGVPGSLVAPKISAPRNVDGDLSDWDTCFVAFDRNNAYSVRDIAGSGQYSSGEFSVVHDGSKIYVAVRMTQVDAPGNETGTSLFFNDSAEIYFDADGTLAQTYEADTIQMIVDHTGKRQGFRNQMVVDSPSARSAARLSGGMITLELEITPQTLGRAAFSNTLGFDVALNNSDGTRQLTQLIWFQKCRKSSGCGCADGNDAPYCDGRQFGSLVLAP